MDHEAELINAFVVPSKRERLIEFLRSPKRRAKVLATLDHFRDLDPKFIVQLEPSEQHATAIAALLGKRGAPSQCHLISSNRELDGRDLPLKDALERVVGLGFGTLISSIPGRLAYFEGESPRDRFILEKAAA